jgi:multidrug efflux pump subunit AcrA (membrane-fusion protein)
MDMVQPSEAGRVMARVLVGAMGLIAFVLVVTPWQQTAPGSGKVVAYAPDERRQNIESPIEGRVLRWYVQEGSPVKKGDPLVDLTDYDPDALTRLSTERDAVAARLEAARQRAQSIQFRISSMEDSRASAIAAAESRVRMAVQRVTASEQAVALAEATLHTAELNIARQSSLAEKGLVSTRQVELTSLEETRGRTELERAKVALTAARAEQAALSSDLQKAGNDATAGINDARAALSSAEAEVAGANAELARIEGRRARQSAQSLVAPRDGSVFRIVANGQAGEIVKSGDVLAILVPDTNDRAVEVYVSGNDMPLVRPGADARVQFEGWPALQFSGWPSVAIGTFAGKVAFVDATDNGTGQFRVLLVPKEGHSWPAPLYLRQGVRAHGWVQLGRVRLGYELWRQFNGFPPSLGAEPGKGPEDGNNKPDKSASYEKGTGK